MPADEKDAQRAPYANRCSCEIKTGTWRTFRPVLDIEKCSRCYTCWKFCPDLAITIKDDYTRIDYDYCKGCGICANECPKGCIEMVKEDLDSNDGD